MRNVFPLRYELNFYILQQVYKPSARGYNWATLFLGGYKYGNLALQVGGVSDETVKYGYGFSATGTTE
jgi:hypothetical protein